MSLRRVWLGDRPPHIIVRRAAMRSNERAWVDPAGRVIAVTWSDERSGEFPHFEMKMRQVSAARGSDRRNLFPAADLLIQFHQDRFDVAVIGFDEFPRPIL